MITLILRVIDSDNVIRRTITFEPHQIQAGVGLLSYFSEVLKQKCSEANSKVSIEQCGEKVRLRIKSDAGTEHKVEALLNEYGEVLNGTRQPEQLMTDQVQLLSLQNKLDMAAMEVKHQQSILALTKSNYDQRIFSLEEQVADLKHTLSESITSHRIVQGQVSKLIDKYGSNSDVELELLGLAKKLDERAADVQKEELERILKKIHMDNPKLAAEFLSLLKGPLEGVAGNYHLFLVATVGQHNWNGYSLTENQSVYLLTLPNEALWWLLMRQVINSFCNFIQCFSALFQIVILVINTFNTL